MGPVATAAVIEFSHFDFISHAVRGSPFVSAVASTCPVGSTAPCSGMRAELPRRRRGVNRADPAVSIAAKRARSASPSAPVRRAAGLISAWSTRLVEAASLPPPLPAPRSAPWSADCLPPVSSALEEFARSSPGGACSPSSTSAWRGSGLITGDRLRALLEDATGRRDSSRTCSCPSPASPPS